MLIQIRSTAALLALLVSTTLSTVVFAQKENQKNEQRILVQYHTRLDASFGFAGWKPGQPFKNRNAFLVVLQKDDDGKYTTDVEFDPKAHQLMIQRYATVRLQWDLPAKNEAEIDALLKDVEKQMQNGMLFWLEGEWVEVERLFDGFPRIAKFRATSISLTEFGRNAHSIKRIFGRTRSSND